MEKLQIRTNKETAKIFRDLAKTEETQGLFLEKLLENEAKNKENLVYKSKYNQLKETLKITDTITDNKILKEKLKGLEAQNTLLQAQIEDLKRVNDDKDIIILQLKENLSERKIGRLERFKMYLLGK